MYKMHMLKYCSLFQPLIVACNKIDVINLEDLAEKYPEKRELIAVLECDSIPVMEMSTLTQQGVMEVKKEVSINDSLIIIVIRNAYFEV